MECRATGLGRTLTKDKEVVQVCGRMHPIRRIFGIKAEVSGYNNVSGADIRQFLG